MKAHQLIIKLLAAFMLLSLPALMTAENDVVLEAMTDEMNRSMKSLQIENMEKPYYLEYNIIDSRQLKIEAVFGAVTGSMKSHRRSLRVDLRIGDYQFDNTGFMGSRNMYGGRVNNTGGVVTEDDYDAIRHDIWLVTDDVYKSALEQLAAKRAFVENQAQSEEVPDFSKEKSIKDIAPPVTMKVDRGKWESIVKNLSAILRTFPSIHDSGIEMQVRVKNNYYVNSEGTVCRQPETLVFLVAYASTQASDGMNLKHYIPFYAPTVDGLPKEKELAAGVRKMAQELTALVKAPVLEEYIGPVLFSGQASAELFTQILAPHLCGDRPPLTENPRMAEMLTESKLAQRLNRKVLPREISITADPTRTTFEKYPLIGCFKVDDQGVPARPVTVVEKGVLKTLLMSRRPRKEIANSNGHARNEGEGDVGAHMGNLFISTEKGKTYKQLKKELLEFCEDQELSFGLIVKTVDNPVLSGVDSSLSSLLMGPGSGDPKMTPPVMLYKVYVKDGREELVRGISFREITVKNLKDIAAVGNDSYVHNRMVTGRRATGSFAFFSGGSNRGAGIPSAVVAPSVLFEELELKKDEGSWKNPPLLVHPFFR